jgi:rhamnulokinase
MTAMVAVDIGAQSGRVALGRFDGERLSVDEVMRFPNVPVLVRDTLHWDVLRLYDGILAGLAAAAREGGGQIQSVGIDTWGVDFALLDRAGRLVQNPVHHRDRRIEGTMERVFELVSPLELYERTGIQLMQINTLFQLFAMGARQDPALEVAEKLLLIPDLFNYWLSGVALCELTNATTSQCLDARRQAWAIDLLERLEIPSRLFADLVPPGTVIGHLVDEVADQTQLRRAVLVAPATHDTGSAVAAVPFRSPDAVYISSGTWSLVGMELPTPLINHSTFAANLTNEGGVEGTSRLLRNVGGLWLLHECRRAWAAHGKQREFGELAALAEEAAPLRSFVDPNDPAFLAPGDMPARIRDFCAATGQEVPEDDGALIRCVLESLVLKYRQTIELLEAATGAAPPEVHVVGGGARNSFLCRGTADATGLPVLAGPVEATEIGNLLVQAIGLGALGSLAEAREVVRDSFPLTVYEPGDRGPWDQAFARFTQLAGGANTDLDRGLVA